MNELENPEASSFEMPPVAWRALFASLAAGQTEAFETLYDLSARTLYGLALWRTGSKEDAADVVQQVFLRLVERRNRLTEVDDPRGWLLAVTHRAAVDLCRRRSIRKTEPLDACEFLSAPPENREREIDARRASRLVAELPPQQRSVIYLRHFAGHTFDGAGRVLGIPQFTAASRYRLGIKKLRDLMEASDEKR